MTLDLTWLGQAGFLLETPKTRLLIDPWVSPAEGRLIESPPLELVADRIDFVIVTHEHADHFDLAFLRQLAERSPDAVLVLPEPIAEQGKGVLALSPVRPGDRVELVDFTLDVVPAFHALRVEDPCTDGEGRFVGYVIRVAGAVVYHAGDTLAMNGLLAALDGKPIDVALLPINGRDSLRESQGIVGNLDFREAVQLAVGVGAHTLIPYHWDGFAGNTERPGRVVEEAARVGGLHVLCLARLAPYRIR
jgi:L-ascorbate metabolism protein UlaG (beta-lactamase superfamily)